jgi:hypothetical protein
METSGNTMGVDMNSYTITKALDLYKWVNFELSHRGTRFQHEFSQYCADHGIDESYIIELFNSDINNFIDGPVWEE